MKPDNEPTPEQDAKRVKLVPNLIAKNKHKVYVLDSKRLDLLQELDAIKARQKARGDK